MRILPLSEGAFTVDKTKAFVPFNLETDQLQNRPIGSLLVEIQPFLVITNNDVILIDAGLGFTYDGQLQLHQNIIKQGYHPNQVTKVLMSHLHKDHTGGLFMRDKFGDAQLSFTHATYYIHELEFESAMQVGFPSYMVSDLAILQHHPQVCWLKGNGQIDGFITYQLTAAHSPCHQVFWIQEDNEIVFFGGDDAPQYQQMKNKFIAKYDFDGKKTMQLRQQWWDEGQHKWTFLFYHDIKTPIHKPTING